MPSLPTKSFSQIVTDTTAGIQGRAAKLIDFSEGSTLLAIAEGFAGTFLWFQAMMLELLTAIRLSTSKGNDVDTFTADFMPLVSGTTSPRLGAQFASGEATFSRFTAAPTTCFISVGSTMATSDGNNTQFAVVANLTYGTYSPTPAPGGYTLASNVADIVVPVQASVAGAAGNVSAGALNTITSPIRGIDTVTNTAAFTNGANQESDSALKKRFADYILGLSRGDVFGLNSAIEGTAVTVQWTLTEGYNLDGSYHPGYFFVIADDGSGTPSPEFLDIVDDAAQSVRPLTVQCSVFPPTVVLANVSMQLTTADGYDHNVVVAQVAASVALNINNLGLGNELPWSILASWAYAIPGVTKVENVFLNGEQGDAATITTFRLTQDLSYRINYITIKAGVMLIS
jgi:hypothetical protein